MTSKMGPGCARSSVRFLVCLAALCAWRCVPGPPAPAPRAGDGSRSADMARADRDAAVAAFPDAAERRALYQELVGFIRKHHQFAEQTAANLEIDWEDSLKRLEPAFVEATDEAALREALHRMASSLHDPHLGYESGKPSDRILLGLTLEGEWREGRAEYRVKSVDNPALRDRVQPGDVLVAVNDVAAEQVPRVYRDYSKFNNWTTITWALARYYLTRRDAAASRTRPGAVERWRLRRPGAAADYQIELRWERGKDSKTAEEELRTDDPDYLPARCHPYNSDVIPYPGDRDYTPIPNDPRGGYRIRGYGSRFCLYTSEQPPYSHYPIIRHFSFFYFSALPRDPEHETRLNTEATYAVAADYFALSRLLRERPQTRGLILDLRDNGGGNDPEWFLDWYAPAPFENHFTAVRVAPEWEDKSFTARVVNINADWLKWYRQAASGDAPGGLIKRPSKCLRSDCSGGSRYSPARALLKVPVALLVSRGCNSSCAHLANVFDEYEFGPLIGEPVYATLTSQAYAHPVRTRSGLELGQIKLALNVSLSGKTGQSLEGAGTHIDYPIPMPAPMTADSRATWEAAHLAAALRAFKEYRFPKHVTPLGP